MLTSSERFSLGSLNSIRGFKDFGESSDNGLFLRNEIITLLPTTNSPMFKKFFGDLSSFIGFDFGYFVNHEEKEKRSGKLSGISAGIRNNYGVFNIDFTIARPTKSTYKSKHKNVVYFTLGASL